MAKQNNRVAARLANLERSFAALRAEAGGSIMPTEYQHLSPTQFAQSQGFKRSWGKALITDNKISAVRIGGRLRIPLSSAIAWVAAELQSAK